MSVNEVSDATLNDFVTHHGNVFIACWVPWFATECKTMLELFEEYNKTCKHKVKFATMDVSKNPETVKRFRITVFPHMLLFKNGRHQGAIFGRFDRDRLDLNLSSYPKK